MLAKDVMTENVISVFGGYANSRGRGPTAEVSDQWRAGRRRCAEGRGYHQRGRPTAPTRGRAALRHSVRGGWKRCLLAKRCPTKRRTDALPAW